MSRFQRVMALAAVLLGVVAPVTALAQDAGPVAEAVAPVVDTGDTAWMLASAGLVLLMTPGLAFFYGGLVRRKNVLSVLMQCFMAMCVVTLQWVVLGYTLSFGPDLGGWIGTLKWAFLETVGAEPNPDYAATIPHSAFMAFQLKFAIITPALIIGAMAERIRFSAFFLFTILWTTLVYDPVAHWVWGHGSKMGALDLPGGTVVHINGERRCRARWRSASAGFPLRPTAAARHPRRRYALVRLVRFNRGSAAGREQLAANALSPPTLRAAGLTRRLRRVRHSGRPRSA